MTFWATGCAKDAEPDRSRHGLGRLRPAAGSPIDH